MVIITSGFAPTSAPAMLTAPIRPPTHAGLTVRDLGFDVGRGRRLIDDMSFTAPAGTLTAIIGPSGAGKSTLSRLLAGLVRPGSGEVRFDGIDVWEGRSGLSARIGLVPQDDLVHRQLTLRRALRHAASLRLPQVTAGERAARVDSVIGRLGLAAVAERRIDRLSGGQRKRSSVAMELLTEPALLILDEPTSGLDPALDRQVMGLLRGLADGERSVVVVTHSLANLDVCDQVLILAPGGVQAYFGPPSGVADHFGTGDWGDIFESVTTEPRLAQRRWMLAAGRPASSQPERSHSRAGPPPDRRATPGWLRQFGTVAVRQAQLILADRGYTAFLFALPFALGALTALVPGGSGLAFASPMPFDEVRGPRTELVLLIIGGAFLGVAASIRDLVSERAIWLRERAAGLRASAGLAAKLAVYGVTSTAAAAIMTLLAITMKPGPQASAIPLLPPGAGLFVLLAVTIWTSAALGLAISAFVSTTAQVMPLLVVVLMVQLVLHGGLITVVGNQALEAVSMLTPGRWAFAAAASSVDLEGLIGSRWPVGLAPMRHDWMWAPSAAVWTLDMAVLTAMGGLCAVAAWLGLRRGH